MYAWERCQREDIETAEIADSPAIAVFDVASSIHSFVWQLAILFSLQSDGFSAFPTGNYRDNQEYWNKASINFIDPNGFLQFDQLEIFQSIWASDVVFVDC